MYIFSQKLEYGLTFCILVAQHSVILNFIRLDSTMARVTDYMSEGQAFDSYAVTFMFGVQLI